MTTRAHRATYRQLDNSKVDGRAVIVGIHPDGSVSFRLKGQRRVLHAPALWLYETTRRYEKRAATLRRKAATKQRRIDRQNDMIFKARDGDRASREWGAVHGG